MSHRLKSYNLIILTTLIILLLVGPPLAIANNLPTVCNIFVKKTTDKAGSCNQRFMVSKFQDKSFELGAILYPIADLEIGHPVIAPSIIPSSLLSSNSLPQSNPLRC
jgi:hypothetical protein